MIIYLTCGGNNRAETVLEVIEKKVQCYGLPSRFRSDHSWKNVGVGKFVLEGMGFGRRSIIIGRSVRNSRIEPLHRDTCRGALSCFLLSFSIRSQISRYQECILCLPQRIKNF